MIERIVHKSEQVEVCFLLACLLAYKAYCFTLIRFLILSLGRLFARSVGWALA